MKRGVVIIGSGNVAWHMTARLTNAGLAVQLYSRTDKDIPDYNKYFPDAVCITDERSIRKDAAFYILCVNDDAIRQAADIISFPLGADQVLVHTSGSVSSDILRYKTRLYGVLWPIMSLTKLREVQHPDNIPFVVTASNQEAEYYLSRLTEKLTHNFSYADDALRKKMHLAAVISNNFSNHLYALTYKYCVDNHIDFDKLNPIIEETIARMQGINPAMLQTGPAVRNDQATIQEHLDMLGSDAALKKIYQQLTNSIINMYKKS